MIQAANCNASPAPCGSERRARLTPLRRAFSAYRPVIGATVVFSVVINLLLFVSPLYMLQVYDQVMTSRSTPTLMMISLMAAAAIAIYALLEFCRSRMLVRAGIAFDAALAEPLFEAVLTADRLTPGRGTPQALRDMDSLRDFLTGAGLVTLCDAPWVPLFITLNFLLHPLLGIVSLAGAVVIFSLALLNEVLTRGQLRAAGLAGGRGLGLVTAALRNREAVHAMGMRAALATAWRADHDAHLAWQASASDRGGAVLAMTKFVRLALQTAILGSAAYLAVHNELSPGSIVAASLLMGRALQPVEQTVAQWRGFIAAREAHGRLKALFLALPAPVTPMPLPQPEGALSCEDLSVTPPGAAAACLRNVAFTLEPGEALAVVGPSGAGKTTLLRALIGIWPASAGAVRLDGAAIENWDNTELGRFVGYVPQDVELFAGSVADNIARFTDPDPAEVVAAARLAGVHDLIQRLPAGYDTDIGPGGAVLSGGQRQRIALARALYRRPKLVVLDEPNANLDADGELALMDAMRALKAAGTTLVVSSHKINLLGLADRILPRSSAKQA